MKKMIWALPFAVLMACNSSRNTTTTTDANTTDDASVTGTTAMSGDMTDTTVTGTSGNSGVYSSGSATVNANNTVDYNTMHNSTWDSRNNWRGDSTYMVTGGVYSDVNNPWIASPRNNWYNRYNTSGDDWMSVYYPTMDNSSESMTMMTDTSAVYGGWTLTMTPDLATAWRNDLNESGYVYTNLNNNGNNAYMSGSATVGSNSGNMSSSTTKASGGSTVTYGNATVRGNEATGSVSGSTNTFDSSSVNMSGSSSMGTTNMSGSATVWNNTNGASPNMYGSNGNMYMMPRLNLYLMNGSFSGFTGCNNISGRLSVGANGMLHFDNTTPSTNIDCVAGFDQNVMLDRLRRADNYAIVNNQLQLRQGDQVLLVFDKNH